MVKINNYELPEDLYYTKDFEWLKIEGEKVRQKPVAGGLIELIDDFLGSVFV